MFREIKKYLYLTTAVILAFPIISCENNDNDNSIAKVETLPGVSSFLTLHTEYGIAKSVKNMPNWADGKRQQVRTSKGSYLFYLTNGNVVTVYLNDSSGRKEIWRKKGS